MNRLERLGRWRILMLVLLLLGLYVLWRQASWWPRHIQIGADVLALQFSSDGTHLLALTETSRGLSLLQLDPENLSLLESQNIKLGGASIALSAHKKLLAVANDSWGQNVRIYDAQTGDYLYQRHTQHIVFSPYGNWVCDTISDPYDYGNNWHLLRQSGNHLQEMALKGGHISASQFAFSRDGQALVVGGDFGDVGLYDLKTLKQIRLWSNLHDDGGDTGVSSLTISNQGQWVATKHIKNVIYLWNSTSGNKQSIPATFAGPLVFSPDDTLLAGAGDGVWDLKNATTARYLPPSPAINCQCFSPDSNTLYTAVKGGTLTRWRIR